MVIASTAVHCRSFTVGAAFPERQCRVCAVAAAAASIRTLHVHVYSGWRGHNMANTFPLFSPPFSFLTPSTQRFSCSRDVYLSQGEKRPGDSSK